MKKTLYLTFVAIAMSMVLGSMYSCSKEKDNNTIREGGSAGGGTEYAHLIVGTWNAVVTFNPFAAEDPDFVYYETWVFSSEGEMSTTYPHNARGETTTRRYSYAIEGNYIIINEGELELRVEILKLNATEMQLKWYEGDDGERMVGFIRATA